MSSPAKTDGVRASHELRSLVGRLRRRLRELRAPDEVAPGLLSVMLRLEQDGPATASVLAAAERVSAQSMSVKIAEMQRDGLITRRPDPADGRRQLIVLTPHGKRRIEGDRAARREWLAQALHDRFTADERATLFEAFALLERLFDD